MPSPNLGLNYLDEGSLWNIFAKKPATGVIDTALEAELQNIAVTFNQLVNFIDGGTFNKVTLTAAQIKSLDLDSIPIIPAPGPNKLLIPTYFSVQYKFGSVAYVVPAAITFSFFYGTTASPNAIQSYGESSTNPVTRLFTGPGPNGLFTIAPLFPSSNNPQIAGWGTGVLLTQTFDPSTFENQPIVLGILSSGYNAGPITGLAVANNSTCTGYLAGDTFTIDQGLFFADTGDATGHVVTASGGKPLSVAVDLPGTSYSLTTANPTTGPYPTAHTSGGGNDALTLNVTDVIAGDGTAVISIWYQIITL